MLKMLIVEDEKWERDGLLDFLDWKSFGVEVVETACDGIEGIEKAAKIHPDIIITDIKMPGMDGIAMSKKIKAAMPEVKIIILTGYDDFKLAQEAIRFKADAYILKPLEEAEIIPLIQKVVAECNQVKEKSEKEVLMKEELAQNLGMVRMKFLHDLLEGAIEPEELERQLSHFGIKTLIHDQYTIVIIKMIHSVGENPWRHHLAGESKFTGMDIILAENTWQNQLLFSFPLMKEGRIILCLHQPQGNNTGFHSKISEIFQAIHKDQGSVFVMGIGGPVASVNEISQAYSQARHAAEFGEFWSSFEPVYFKQIESLHTKFVDNENEFLIRCHSFTKQLVAGLRSSDKDRLFELLKEMFQYIKENQGAGKDFVVGYLQSIIHEISLFLYSMHLDFEHSCIDKEIQLAGCKSIQSIEENLTVFLEDTLQKINRRKSNHDAEIVKKVVKLIEERYMSDLGLQIIAREVFLSPNYLGNIFKKCTGKTFNDYLCEWRMEKAKELLKSPQNKVSSVAAMVGIANTSYFCTIFKNTYGMAPGEFQEMFLRNNF